jgi:glycosyltransferase involved in cell wall biosynthesis
MIQQTTARLFSGKPELIHVHSLEFAKAALLLKRQYRIPVVYTCHSLVSARSHSQMVRRKNQALLIRQADQITVPSYWLKNAIRKQHTGSASRITVIPHGVNAIIKGSRVRPYQLLFVGRLLPGKGIEALIRSVALLSVHNRQIRLTVIGKGSPKYQKHLRDLARKLGIQSRIRWLGFLPHRQVQRLYASHGALVVPSKLESFCLVALEAMANGIPLVSTRAGGLKEFVHDGNAQIIRSVNGKAIERAVQAMWRNPKRTRQRIIKAKVVAKRYSWRSAALQYKMLFSRLHRHIVNGRREEVGRAVVGKRV